MSEPAKKLKKKVLGRGLSALISSRVPLEAPDSALAVDEEAVPYAAPQGPAPAKMHAVQIQTNENNSERVTYVGVSELVPNPNQPRREFKEEELKELADSIQALGVLQPVLVRPLTATGNFQIVAGERRWRAARLAGLPHIPVIVRSFNDIDSLQAALVENIQRSDLNAVEEARAYQALIDEFALSQHEIAKQVGKDRTTVANSLRLLKLPEEVLELVKGDQISLGHAKAILTVKEPSAQKNLARKCVTEGLSVRALEEIVSRVVILKTKNQKKRRGVRGGSFPEICDELRRALGTKVKIAHKKSGRGRIEIEYFSEQELDRLVDILTTKRK
jgi:ParB family transcriptional regulator, chromosome partitioning protein